MGPVTAVSVCHGARDSHVVLCDRRPCMGAAVVAHSDVAPVSRTQKPNPNPNPNPDATPLSMHFAIQTTHSSLVIAMQQSSICMGPFHILATPVHPMLQDYRQTQCTRRRYFPYLPGGPHFTLIYHVRGGTRLPVGPSKTSLTFRALSGRSFSPAVGHTSHQTRRPRCQKIGIIMGYVSCGHRFYVGWCSIQYLQRYGAFPI